MTPYQYLETNLQDDCFGNLLSISNDFKTSCQFFQKAHFYAEDSPHITHLDPTWEHFSYVAYIDAVSLGGRSHIYYTRKVISD